MTDNEADQRITAVLKLVYHVLIGIMLGVSLGIMLIGPGSYANGVRAGQLDVRTTGCGGACTRRGTEMSHVHDLMCVCADGQTLTLDYGAMYRPMGQ
jgi:hypothetical protein